jgi:hypothetical protein
MKAFDPIKLFLLILTFQVIHANNIIFYSTINGLSDDIILDIAQDNHGNIWIATNNGLNKISTDKIEVFTENDGLYNNKTRCLYFDQDNEFLFIGTNDGLNILTNKKIYKLLNKRLFNYPKQVIYYDNHIYYINSNGQLAFIQVQQRPILSNKISFDNTNVIAHKLTKFSNRLVVLTNVGLYKIKNDYYRKINKNKENKKHYCKNSFHKTPFCLLIKRLL